MEMNTIANTGIVADALVAFPATASCSSWERSHAFIPAMSSGGVRPLQVPAKRLRGIAGEATYLPLWGSPTSRPPV